MPMQQQLSQAMDEIARRFTIRTGIMISTELALFVVILQLRFR